METVDDPAYPSQEHLDFIRGAAAFCVLINHVRGAMFIGGERLGGLHAAASDLLAVAALQVTAFGLQAVALFFILSGFAMAHSLSRPGGIGRFYLRRALRVWPPYALACVAALAVGHIVGASDIQQRFWQVLFYIDPGTTTSPQFWSLPYEIAFYAIAPLVVRNERNAWITLAISVAIAAGIVANYGANLHPAPWFLVNFAGDAMPFFAVGALLHFRLSAVPVLSKGWLGAALAALLAVILLLRRQLGEVHLLTLALMIPFAALLFRNIRGRIPAWANLGSFSYSIYIFHYAAIALAVWYLRTNWGIDAGSIRNPFAWLALVPLVLAYCLTMYALSEKWSNRAVARLRQ
jgi:peptidoglycan/LPS O-acetylase OafA/YrhL